MELNLDGADLLSSFIQGANAGADCSPGTDGSYATGADGAGLTTSGVLANCAELISPHRYTYGVFESGIDLPAGPTGKIANWPAFWLVGANWPAGGEFDIMEGLGGEQCVHFHYSGGAPGTCQPGVGPGWHTFTGVWGPGYISAYIDGVQVLSWTSASVTSVPMEVLFDMTTGASGNTTGHPSTMSVNYLRIWRWQ
jgi:beta-glucanase (GH16 family)